MLPSMTLRYVAVMPPMDAQVGKEISHSLNSSTALPVASRSLMSLKAVPPGPPRWKLRVHWSVVGDALELEPWEPWQDAEAEADTGQLEADAVARCWLTVRSRSNLVS